MEVNSPVAPVVQGLSPEENWAQRSKGSQKLGEQWGLVRASLLPLWTRVCNTSVSQVQEFYQLLAIPRGPRSPPSIYRRESWGTERLKNLPKVTITIRGLLNSSPGLFQVHLTTSFPSSPLNLEEHVRHSRSYFSFMPRICLLLGIHPCGPRLAHRALLGSPIENRLFPWQTIQQSSGRLI